jgi:ABC-type nitrate/sulfonate/bicarbonate transport system substrate-binding protein
MDPVRLALGLRSTAQSLGVVGARCGIFARHGIDLQLVREETTGPAGIKGLLQGEYDIAELGAVPVVQAALDGADPVIVLAAEKVAALHLLGSSDVTAPADLPGRQVGVLSRAGQTGVSARKILESWRLSDSVALAELGTYPKIYSALQARRIGGGVLTADYGIAGAAAYGFTLLADLGEALGLQAPVVATTRRFLEGNRSLVERIVGAYIETIRFFKSNPGQTLPVLMRHLGFVNEQQAKAIHAFYAARFQDVPLASEEGLCRILDLLTQSPRPGAQIGPGAFYDRSFVMQHSGG